MSLERDSIKNSNKSSKKKWLLFGGIVLLFLISTGIGYAAHLYHKTEEIVRDSHQDIGRENKTSELREVQVDPVEDNVSVLFIGVDTSDERGNEEESRSDALLLATFNKQDKSVKLLSIPRDSYVYVPEVGYSTKINHAHFFGGPKASIDTVEDFLNVPVDYFVRLNFEAFIDVIDSLNGIMIDVPYEMYEMDSEDTLNAIHLNPGYQKLNGEEALALARTRKYDSDIERGERQQEIIKKIVDKATSPSSFFKLGDVLDAVGSNMHTNLSFDEMKSFVSYGLAENVSIEKINLDGNGGFLDDGLWYLFVDEYDRNRAERELRMHLGLPLKDISEFGTDDEMNFKKAY